MRKFLLLTIFTLSALIAWCQPTPRPGQKLIAPTLMPKGSSTLVANKTTKTNTKSVEPRNEDKLLPSTLPMPEATNTNAKASVKKEEDKEEEVLEINWMTIEEAIERNKTEKRKIVIDVYTKWCGWCKRMDQTTFRNPEVVKYINENYYPVRFDAEQQEDIEFNDKVYKFKKNGSRGYHELAAEWLNGRMGYPTTVFLNEDMGVIQPIPGYLDSEKFDLILNYFGSNSHKTTPWESFEKKYKEEKDKKKTP
jgi:thioredoxin-related protein